VIYLDASALLKIVVAEPESGALLAFLRSRPERMSSALSLTEVPRALRRAHFDAAVRRRAQRVRARLALVVREDLDGLVTYDRRLAAAAERLDLEVLAPS